MKTIKAALAMALLCLGLAATPALAQDGDDPILADAMAFAMHDAAFTMYHEVGHMLVDQLGLPVLGKEEDAVDSWATIWLLEFDEADDSYDALIDAADGWYYNAVTSTGSGVDDFSYYDEHSLDIQRAYAMVCLMVGKDIEVFGETADAYDMDADQQEQCSYTYQQAFESWMTLLDPHISEDDEGAGVEVIYDDAGDYEEFAQALKDYQLLEYVAATVDMSFDLPGPVTIRATQCGEANAYYDPSASEVTYCYELADAMFTLYLYDIVGWGDTAN